MRKALLTPLLFTLLLFSYEGCTPSNINKPPPKVVLKHQLYDILVKDSQGKSTLNAIDFLTAPRGITVGNNGTIFLTTTGGHVWRSAGFGLTPLNLHGVSMVDSASAVAVGDGGKILRSIDTSGLNWVKVDTIVDVQTQRTLKAVAFNTNRVGYAVGDSGVILRSSDGGANWTKQHGNASQILNGISFNSNNIPYVAGNNGLILKSTDNGATWISINPTTENLNGIHFSQSQFHTHTNNGFAVGDKGTIIVTTDGGLTWAPVAPVTAENLRGVFISAPHWGYAVGDNGTVVRYNGNTWTLLAKPTIKNLNAVDPSWNPTSVCVGEDGLILDVNPPSVSNQYYKAVEIPTPTGTGCTWGFTVNLIDANLHDYIVETGASVIYDHFEICSSMEMSVFGSGGPNVGWSNNERYFSILRISSNNYSWTSSDPNLYIAPLTFTDLSGNATGFVTCYYIGTDGNPYLAVSAEIDECP